MVATRTRVYATASLLVGYPSAVAIHEQDVVAKRSADRANGHWLWKFGQHGLWRTHTYLEIKRWEQGAGRDQLFAFVL